MKTFDGYEVKAGYYYLVSGQCVYLDAWGEDEDGKRFFSVTPYYEGEGMTCSGGGGSHSEHSFDYEVEGDAIMVAEIFENAPTKKLCSKYTEWMEKVKTEAGIFAELHKASDELGRGIRNKKKELHGLERSIEQVKNKVSAAKLYLSDKFPVIE